MEMTDKEGRKYYFSSLTRKVQWTRPASFAAKEPPRFPSKRRIVGSATSTGVLLLLLLFLVVVS